MTEKPAAKKRRGGKSGRNKQPQRLIRAPAELWESVDDAAAAAGQSFAEFARQALSAGLHHALRK